MNAGQQVVMKHSLRVDALHDCLGVTLNTSRKYYYFE
jgi:hypothetical protein